MAQRDKVLEKQRKRWRQSQIATTTAILLAILIFSLGHFAGHCFQGKECRPLVQIWFNPFGGGKAVEVHSVAAMDIVKTSALNADVDQCPWYFEGFSGLYVIPATVVPELLEKWQPTSGPNGESVVDQKMKERRRKSDRYTKNLSFHHWRVDTLFSLRRREILEKAWCEKHVCSSKGSVQQICDPEAKHFQTKAEKEMCILCWPQQNSTAMDVYCTRVGNAAARTLLGLAGLLILAIVGCFGCLLPSMLRRRKRTVMRRISRKAARDRTMPSKLSWYQKLTSILRPGSHDRKIVSARPGDYPQKKVPNMPPAIKLSPMTDGAPPGEDSNGEGSQIGTACRSASKPRASGSSIEEDRSRVVDRKVTEADHADADVVPGSSRASAHRSHSGD